MVYGDRLMRLLAEEALCRLPSIVEGEVITPCGVSKGFVEKRKMNICLVSVVRSGILHMYLTMKEQQKMNFGCNPIFITNLNISYRRYSARGC